MTFRERLIELRKGFRLRVGDYRIIFDKKGSILLIKKIDNRGQIYKGV
jgi:mRNA-degrading endonuclease RelE of RelBE toxin-antitoxin system